MHKLFYGFFLLFFITTPFAAKPIDLRQQTISTLKDSNLQFTEIQSTIDFNQTKHIRLQEMFSGYPVWGSDIVVHIPHGKDISFQNSMRETGITMNGVIIQDINQDLNKKFTFSNTQANYILQHAISQYQTVYGENITNKQSKPIVYIDDKHIAHWAYLISFNINPLSGIPKHPTFIIDATTLIIYKQWDNIKTLSDTIGGGYGGNEKIGQFTYDGINHNYPSLAIQRDDNKKICYLKNNDVTVKDANHNGEIIKFNCNEKNNAHGNVYWDGNYDAVNGAYSPSNDALFVGQVIKDMYQTWYGIPVLISHKKPMMLDMQVHFKIDNAFWDGKQMTFGDGIDLFYPLVSLGVGAHEISHGFTQQHSNLMYYGQSGALNEAFSDMASQAALYYLKHQNNWKIGDDILKAKNKALRYMDEPTKDCVDIPPNNQCSISNAHEYHDELDVHYSSGVFNKLFYLLATSNDWDVRKAFNIMVQANQHYWTSTSDFKDAAHGILQAAKDYHYSLSAISRAIKLVGIDID